MHDGLAALRIDDRLIGELETVLLETRDDLGGAARIEIALRTAARRRLEQYETVGGKFLGFGQCLFGARHGGIRFTGIEWQYDAADRQHGPDRPAFRLDDALARHIEKPLGRGAQIVFIAIVENDAEFAARIARQCIAGAHDLAQAPSDGDDHFVGNFETIGVVDDGEIVDRRNRKGARNRTALGNRDGLAERFRHAPAIHHAGQGIAIAEEAQMPVAAMAIVDAADDAVDLGGAAVLSGIPASAILKPYGLAADAAERAEEIFDLKRNAGAFVLRLAAHHGVIAAGEIVGVEHLGKGFARCQRSEIATQHVGGIGAP